ncbi:MAG: hypothetical protein UT41_C0003G0087 [Candidatus Wolfebacteria bacterium GW2011_GWC2_39_22]|uniref:DUF4177 domain-containing protein n=1 Tax=Candidatus Wolfebacteria bacterium GW2011_GWC2_39_22 TaxID=1619013 RepID=A0A0G0QP42_9BACT|nr:MAG: hypothetical protein UT41_C0003G0087 [Candidatus Wolfebacteria bacterium GW2011_GWC2_39_22]
MKKWEYYVGSICDLNEARLNELGKEGWELVVFTHSSTGDHRAIFKRERMPKVFKGPE